MSFSTPVVEPATELRVTDISSKSMRITWGSSPGDITGYKLQVFPKIAGAKKQELYTGPTFTVANVRDLSPETEYEISLFALKGLTPSKPQVVSEKTQPVKVSTGKMLTTHFDHASEALFTAGIKMHSGQSDRK